MPYKVKVCSTEGCGRLVVEPVYTKVTKTGFTFKTKPSGFRFWLRKWFAMRGGNHEAAKS